MITHYHIMDAPKFINYIGFTYYITLITLDILYYNDIDNCINTIPLNPIIYISQLFSILFIISLTFYVTRYNLITFFFTLLFYLTTFVFSSIITFFFTIKLNCSKNIFLILFIQSIWFFIPIITTLIKILLIIQSEQNNLKNIFYSISTLTWSIITIIYLFDEEYNSNCYTNFSKIIGILQVTTAISSIILKLFSVNTQYIYFFFITAFFGILNITIAGKSAECYTNLKICSIIPTILCFLLLLGFFIGLIFIYFYKLFISSIMMTNNYNFQDVLFRLEIIIKNFPIIELIPSYPQNSISPSTTSSSSNPI